MQYTVDKTEIEPFLARLAKSNQAFDARHPGLKTNRQPIHTVYGGANLYQSGTAGKIAQLSQKHFDQYAPDAATMAAALGVAIDSEASTDTEAFGSSSWIANNVFKRVQHKLATEAVEDHRIDFEDGYGARSDEEEDGHARSTAIAMATALQAQLLPPFVGIRIKSLSEEGKHRALRTLDLFITTLMAQTGVSLPENFTITLPKVISKIQVEVLCDYLDLLETRNGIPDGHIQIELMLENVQSLFNVEGKVGLPEMIAAGKQRVSCLILGTFDYTATCNVAATFQDHKHPAADFARQMMLANVMGTEVALCDGITNIMPIAPHKGTALTNEQLIENQQVVHAAWKLHFDNIMHSMQLGFYQGWDLNPAQIPIRYCAVYYFYLTGLEDSTNRLKTFIDKAAQASMVGNTFDDAATGQGLVNFFVNGMGCGALSEAEALATGITIEELKQRSFTKIVENRTQG
ncbi:MAG: hypothetical protein KUG79_06955 [Pseudomonadales bacterium]|nr:hypothetical protein [Pseudomonadales bacterium]